MARPDKAAAVAELAERFRTANAVVLTEYRGLRVSQLKELRRALGGNATYAVVKNTLSAIAAREAGIEGLDAQLTGRGQGSTPNEGIDGLGFDVLLESVLRVAGLIQVGIRRQVGRHLPGRFSGRAQQLLQLGQERGRHGVGRQVDPHRQRGPRVERFEALDLAFIGIGTLEDSVFVERKVLDDSELAKARRSGAVGEICGRFFDQSGQECDSPFRNRVVSIELDALRKGKEVVGVTTGASRGEAVRAALRGGLAVFGCRRRP